MPGTVRIKITELNPHLICVLCGGYYIDASTIRECLHSFCRTCITKYLETTKYCPICDVMVHKTKPLQYVKSDKNLQDLVYKLVPGLYKDEMKRRRDFYANHSEAEGLDPPRPSEARGYEDKDRMIYTEDEKISLALELFSDIPEPSTTDLKNPDKLKQRDIRYLQCPAAVSVAHLKKFIRLKFDLPSKYSIDIFHSDEPLKDFFTLMDIAYIYTWRRTAPLRLLYTVYEQVTKKRKNNEEEMSQTHKQPRIEGKDRGNPKENTSTDSRDYSSPERDQGDENSSPDENEQGTKEPKKECDESDDNKLNDRHDDSTEEDQKFSGNKNSKISSEKPTLTEKDSVKNIMSGKKPGVLPTLHEQGGKFFSSNFYKRRATFSTDIEANSPVDMTKKTLKKHKDVSIKKIGKEQTVVNGNHFPGYEFTD